MISKVTAFRVGLLVPKSIFQVNTRNIACLNWWSLILTPTASSACYACRFSEVEEEEVEVVAEEAAEVAAGVDVVVDAEAAGDVEEAAVEG